MLTSASPRSCPFAKTLDVSKRLWFSGNGAKDYGDATFHTTGDSCSGIVLDGFGGPAASGLVSYGTDPLP